MESRKQYSSIYAVKASDFKFPVIIYLAYFTHMYLAPQYYFPVFKVLEITKITAGLTFIFILLGWNSKKFAYIKIEMICFFLIAISFLSASFLVQENTQTPLIYFKEHIHAVIVGLSFVFYFDRIRLFYFVIVLLILFSAHSCYHAISQGGRIWGHPFLQDENQISALMSMLIPLTLSCSYCTKNWILKSLFYLSMVGQTILIIISFSRGGFVALAVGSVLIIIFSKTRRSWLILLFLTGCILTVTLAPDNFFKSVESIFSEGYKTGTGYQRFEFWRRALIMFKENPFFGKGIDQFRVLSHKYVRPGKIITSSDYNVVHSNWFQILSQMGLYGALCYFLIFKGFFKTWRTIAKSHFKDYQTKISHDEYAFFKNISSGLGFGMICYMISGTFINLLIFPFFYTFVFFMLLLRVMWIERIKE